MVLPVAVLDPDDDSEGFEDFSGRSHNIRNIYEFESAKRRQERRYRRLGLTIGIACAAYAVVVVATLLSGHSGAPWLPVTESEKRPSKPNPIESSGSVFLVFITVLLLFALLTVAAFAISWFLTRRKYMKNQNERFEETLKAQKAYEREVLEKLRKANELATLMELNQGQIATYHRIVTEQADKAFKSSRMAMHIGLLLLVSAAIGGTLVPLEQIRWFIGCLAAFSTLLSGYLTKTYLAMYKESIGQLNRYFDQPVLNSYYLTAERLTNGLDAAHVQDVRKRIINEVLNTSSRMGPKSAATESAPVKSAPKVAGAGKRRSRKNASPINGTSRTEG